MRTIEDNLEECLGSVCVGVFCVCVCYCACYRRRTPQSEDSLAGLHKFKDLFMAKDLDLGLGLEMG